MTGNRLDIFIAALWIDFFSEGLQKSDKKSKKNKKFTKQRLVHLRWLAISTPAPNAEPLTLKRNAMRFPTIGLIRLCCLFLIIAWPVLPVRSDTATPEATFLEQLALQGIPAGYGIILGELTDKAGDALVDGVKSGSGDLATLASQKVWRDRISNVSQAIGRLAAVLDVGGKVYSGQTEDAVVAGSLAVLGELAGTESGKALLKAYGITPPVVSALIISVQITWDSYQALARETTANQIERLYSAVASMTGSTAGRTLGQGDPYPVTAANLEKVWQRILYDPQFRELFRAYVVDQLQKTFPEPEFFNQVAIYRTEPAVDSLTGAALPRPGVAGGTVDLSQPDIPDAAFDPVKDIQRRVREQHDEIKPYVAGLVGYLNRTAKIREQQVALQRRLLELQAKLGAGSSVEDVIEKLRQALVMSGVVETYLSTCMADIAKAAEAEDYQTLQAHMKTAVDYVRDVVAWLPAAGPTEQLHKELLKGLKASYTAARSAFEAFREELRGRIDKPKPPERTIPGPPAAGQVDAVTIDPASYYDEHFKPLLKPYDWGGLGSHEEIRKLYESLLEAGQFTPPKGIQVSRPDHAPLADSVERAWQMQNFPAALNPPSLAGQVPHPDAQQTLEGYKKDLAYKVRRGYPESITSLQRSLDDQGQIIGDQWKKGHDMWWGRNPTPPAGETDEQRRARRDAGTAIMDAATAAGEALQPARQQLAAMQEAWEQARQMAQSAAASKGIEAQMEYDAVSVWMKGLRAEHNTRFLALAHKRLALAGQLGGLSLAPADAVEAGDVLPQLADAKTFLDANAYTRLGSGFLNKAQASPTELVNALTTRADRMTALANTLRTSVGRTAGEALRLADAYDDACRVMDGLKAEAAEDIAQIQRLLDPTFFSQDTYSRRRAATPHLAEKLRRAAEPLAAQAEQHAGNMQADAVWLRQVAAHFDQFVSLGSRLDIMTLSGGSGTGFSFRTPHVNGGRVMLKNPYPRVLTETEKTQYGAKLRGAWNDSPLHSFAGQYAPALAEMVRDYFEQLDRLPGFNEDNFLIRTASGGWPDMPVTPSRLERVEKMMAGVSPGTEAYKAAFDSLAAILPMEIKYYKETGYAPTFEPVVVPEGLAMARRYTAFRNGLMASYANHARLWAALEQERRQQALERARAELSGLAAALNDRINEGKRLIEQSARIADGDRPAISEAIAALDDFRMNRLLADPYPQAREMNYTVLQHDGPAAPLVRSSGEALQAIGRLSSEIAAAIEQLRSRQTLRTPDVSSLATEFYGRFKSAYEARDAVQVMRCIDDDWSAGDGTTLDDLEVVFNRTFDLFDAIRFDLSGLKVEPLSDNRVRASYSLVITGRIYQTRLEHVERSTVTEEIMLDGERSRILQTMQGSFWYNE